MKLRWMELHFFHREQTERRIFIEMFFTEILGTFTKNNENSEKQIGPANSFVASSLNKIV